MVCNMIVLVCFCVLVQTVQCKESVNLRNIFRAKTATDRQRLFLNMVMSGLPQYPVNAHAPSFCYTALNHMELKNAPANLPGNTLVELHLMGCLDKNIGECDITCIKPQPILKTYLMHHSRSDVHNLAREIESQKLTEEEKKHAFKFNILKRLGLLAAVGGASVLTVKAIACIASFIAFIGGGVFGIFGKFFSLFL